MLIAIHGKLRSGKGTIVSHLNEKYGIEHQKMASGLKAMAEKALEIAGYPRDIIDRCIESDLKEVPLPGLGGFSTRRVMQVIGTDWRVQFAPQVWTTMARKAWRRSLEDGADVAIDDLRMPHELTAFQEEGAFLICVERNGIEDIISAMPSDVDAVIDMVKAPVAVDEAFVRSLMDVFISRLFPGDPDISYLDTTPRPELDGASLAQATKALRTWDSMLGKPVKSLNHSSENGLPLEAFDVVLQNDGTIEDLKSKVDNVMYGLAQRHVALSAF